MKRKYYMRGLGVGILITTLVFSFLNSSEPTDEEIIKRAEELGYVLPEPSATPGINLGELIGKETPAPTLTPTPTNTPEPTQEPVETKSPEATAVPEETLTPEPTPTEVPRETLTPEPTPTEVPKATDTPVPTPTVTVIKSQINIVRGTTASQICRMIEEAGIVEDWEDYRRYLVGRGLASEINIGTFELSSDMTYEDITRIITGK